MSSSKSRVHFAFEDHLKELELEKIIPVKLVTPPIRKSSKYKQILSSIEAIGIIEPLAVKRERKKSKNYVLLDGHLRLEALKQLKFSSAICMVSDDDETYTFNKFINRIAPVQEHRMILKAVERGVSEKKIAQALNIEVSSISMKRDLLRGICPEVAEMLKNKIIGFAVFRELRKMKAIRQIESVKLMESANNFTLNYTRMLLAATPREQLVKPDKPKNLRGLDPEQIARMETEMQQLQKEFSLVEERYGDDVLQHTLIKSYLRTLFQNNKVKSYIRRTHENMHDALERIIQET